jgi:Raf kinase inhibitor-like YbhB/YbcL family protein
MGHLAGNEGNRWLTRRLLRRPTAKGMGTGGSKDLAVGLVLPGGMARSGGVTRSLDLAQEGGVARSLGVALAAVLILLGIIALASSRAVAADTQGAAAKGSAKAGKFALVSPDIGQDQNMAIDQVYNGFGCTGKNISPALFWSGAPAGTQSFAIMVHDPDAPTGSGFWHWVIYNIPANATSIPTEAGDTKKKIMPAGIIQGRSDFGTYGYGGPCPPPGKVHHYHFRIFALKVAKLDVAPDASPALIGFNVNANKLAEADLVGLYGR